MKKKVLALASALILILLSGCSENDLSSSTSAPTPSSAPESTAPATEPEQISEVLKLGLGVVSTMDGMSAEDSNGTIQIDSLAAAVVVDGDGRIVDCAIDMSWNSISFTPEGQVVRQDSLPSKRELGDDYGMKAASAIGKEWYEQADAIEVYAIEKTAEEIAGIALTEEGRPADVELAAGASIHLSDFQAALIQAVHNAEERGTQAGDKLGLGIFTHMDFSADASAEMNGNCEADALFAAVTVDEEGKITSIAVDANQGAAQIDTEGKIISELTPFPTKRELGDNYGMKAASAIGKEWYEQADFIEEYAIGKTASEIAGIAMDEDDRALDVPDLVAGATVRFNVFQAAIVRAIQNAV